MTIKVGSVSLPFHQHARGWRFAYKDTNGTWKYVTRADKSEAIELARAKARELSNGYADLSKVAPDTASLLQRVLALGITHAELDAWQTDRQRPALSVADAVEEFLAAKLANRGRSMRNVSSLSGTLNKLAKRVGDMPLRNVAVTDLELWLASYGTISPRRRKNLRSATVTFFRWCRRRGYLPETLTAAEKLESPSISRRVPETWEPAEMRKMLDACPKEYLSWLVLSGFAGIRQEELITDPKSDKSPLDWSDFHWDRKILIVRPETAKTGDRRVVPILPVVRAWLHSERLSSGRVCPVDPPYKARDAARPSTTAMLAELVGGWRRNALRHSFISYRAAQVGLAQTAMEAGNSETEARRSYNDAKDRATAKVWFGLLPR
jgi:integrase